MEVTIQVEAKRPGDAKPSVSATIQATDMRMLIEFMDQIRQMPVVAEG